MKQPIKGRYKAALVLVMAVLAQPAAAAAPPTVAEPSTFSLLAAAGAIGAVVALRKRRK